MRAFGASGGGRIYSSIESGSEEVECRRKRELEESARLVHSLIRAMAPRYGLDGVVPCIGASACRRVQALVH